MRTTCIGSRVGTRSAAHAISDVGAPPCCSRSSQGRRCTGLGIRCVACRPDKTNSLLRDWRKAAAVAASAGKKDSSANSDRVTSIGVPKTVVVLMKLSTPASVASRNGTTNESDSGQVLLRESAALSRRGIFAQLLEQIGRARRRRKPRSADAGARTHARATRRDSRCAARGRQDASSARSTLSGGCQQCRRPRPPEAAPRRWLRAASSDDRRRRRDRARDLSTRDRPLRAPAAAPDRRARAPRTSARSRPRPATHCARAAARRAARRGAAPSRGSAASGRSRESSGASEEISASTAKSSWLMRRR